MFKCAKASDLTRSSPGQRPPRVCRPVALAGPLRSHIYTSRRQRRATVIRSTAIVLRVQLLLREFTSSPERGPIRTSAALDCGRAAPPASDAPSPSTLVSSTTLIPTQTHDRFLVSRFFYFQSYHAQVNATTRRRRGLRASSRWTHFQTQVRKMKNHDCEIRVY